jgi:hypothetical protein
MFHCGFTAESLVDEAAHSAGIDALAYRQALLKVHPRHLSVEFSR